MQSLTEKVKEAVLQQTSYLSGCDQPELEDLLKMAKWNRRVRNVTPLYALFFQHEKWRKLSKQNGEVFSLELQLKKALFKLEQSNTEASLIADELKKTFYPGGKLYVLTNKRDTSDEIAKMLLSLVRSVNLHDSLSDSTRRCVEQRLNKVDFDNLFVT